MEAALTQVQNTLESLKLRVKTIELKEDNPEIAELRDLVNQVITFKDEEYPKLEDVVVKSRSLLKRHQKALGELSADSDQNKSSMAEMKEEFDAKMGEFATIKASMDKVKEKMTLTDSNAERCTKLESQVKKLIQNNESLSEKLEEAEKTIQQLVIMANDHKERIVDMETKNPVLLSTVTDLKAQSSELANLQNQHTEKLAKIQKGSDALKESVQSLNTKVDTSSQRNEQISKQMDFIQGKEKLSMTDLKTQMLKLTKTFDDSNTQTNSSIQSLRERVEDVNNTLSSSFKSEIVNTKAYSSKLVDEAKTHTDSEVKIVRNLLSETHSKNDELFNTLQKQKIELDENKGKIEILEGSINLWKDDLNASTTKSQETVEESRVSIERISGEVRELRVSCKKDTKKLVKKLETQTREAISESYQTLDQMISNLSEKINGQITSVESDVGSISSKIETIQRLSSEISEKTSGDQKSLNSQFTSQIADLTQKLTSISEKVTINEDSTKEQFTIIKGSINQNNSALDSKLNEVFEKVGDISKEGNEKNKQLKKLIESMQSDLTQTQGTLDSLIVQLKEKLDAQKATTSQKLAAIQDSNEAISQTLGKLTTQIEKIEVKVIHQEGAINKIEDTTQKTAGQFTSSIAQSIKIVNDEVLRVEREQSQKVTLLQESLTGKTDALNAEREKLTESIESLSKNQKLAETSIADFTKKLTKLSGKIELVDQLTKSDELINRKLDEVSENLSGTNKRVASIVETTNDRCNSIEEKLSEQTLLFEEKTRETRLLIEKSNNDTKAKIDADITILRNNEIASVHKAIDENSEEMHSAITKVTDTMKDDRAEIDNKLNQSVQNINSKLDEMQKGFVTKHNLKTQLSSIIGQGGVSLQSVSMDLDSQKASLIEIRQTIDATKERFETLAKTTNQDLTKLKASTDSRFESNNETLNSIKLDISEVEKTIAQNDKNRQNDLSSVREEIAQQSVSLANNKNFVETLGKTMEGFQGDITARVTTIEDTFAVFKSEAKEAIRQSAKLSDQKAEKQGTEIEAIQKFIQKIELFTKDVSEKTDQKLESFNDSLLENSQKVDVIKSDIERDIDTLKDSIKRLLDQKVTKLKNSIETAFESQSATFEKEMTEIKGTLSEQANINSTIGKLDSEIKSQKEVLDSMKSDFDQTREGLEEIEKTIEKVRVEGISDLKKVKTKISEQFAVIDDKFGTVTEKMVNSEQNAVEKANQFTKSQFMVFDGKVEEIEKSSTQSTQQAKSIQNDIQTIQKWVNENDDKQKAAIDTLVRNADKTLSSRLDEAIKPFIENHKSAQESLETLRERVNESLSTTSTQIEELNKRFNKQIEEERTIRQKSISEVSDQTSQISSSSLILKEKSEKAFNELNADINQIRENIETLSASHNKLSQKSRTNISALASQLEASTTETRQTLTSSINSQFTSLSTEFQTRFETFKAQNDDSTKSSVTALTHSNETLTKSLETLRLEFEQKIKDITSSLYVEKKSQNQTLKTLEDNIKDTQTLITQNSDSINKLQSEVQQKVDFTEQIEKESETLKTLLAKEIEKTKSEINALLKEIKKLQHVHQWNAEMEEFDHKFENLIEKVDNFETKILNSVYNVKQRKPSLPNQKVAVPAFSEPRDINVDVSKDLGFNIRNALKLNESVRMIVPINSSIKWNEIVNLPPGKNLEISGGGIIEMNGGGKIKAPTRLFMEGYSKFSMENVKISAQVGTGSLDYSGIIVIRGLEAEGLANVQFSGIDCTSDVSIVNIGTGGYGLIRFENTKIRRSGRKTISPVSAEDGGMGGGWGSVEIGKRVQLDEGVSWKRSERITLPKDVEKDQY